MSKGDHLLSEEMRKALDRRKADRLAWALGVINRWMREEPEIFAAPEHITLTEAGGMIDDRDEP